MFEARDIHKVKIAYKPLWPSNMTAERILEQLEPQLKQGMEAGVDLKLLKLRIRSLMDAVTMATKPIHAPHWVSGDQQAPAQGSREGPVRDL